MRAKKFSILLFVIVGILFSGTVSGDNVPLSDVQNFSKAKVSPERKRSVKPNLNFGNIPLYFIHNKGQVDKKALFYAKTPGYTLWVTKEGLVFDSVRNSQGKSKKAKVESRISEPSDISLQLSIEKTKPQIQNPKSETNSRDVSRLLFVGANKDVEVVSLDSQKHRVNYFKGNDKSKWVTDVPTSGAVLYKEIYTNIDLKVYGIGKQIEYDWMVHPGGDPSDIKFEYKNVKYISINKKGDLDIKTKFGKLSHKKPFAYQNEPQPSAISPSQKQKKKKEIKADFKKISETTFGFITGKYDKTKLLTIDPVVLIYSTYFGANWSDGSMDIDVDNSGCAYITGWTGSANFFLLENPFQNTYGGGSSDAFVTKFSADGGSLVYSSFLGGSDREWGSSIKVDNNGAAYITGATESTDFPMQNALYNTYMGGGGDVFVTKISPAGDSLEYSTYLGGSGVDRGEGIDIDSYGYAYVTGWTLSNDFPVNNQYQDDQGATDAFVSKLTFILGNLNLAYSSYFGGFGDDRAIDLEVYNESMVFVTGNTATDTGFPLKNELQGTFGGGNIDVFIARFNTTNSGNDSLVWSTYFGGNGTDSDPDICVDGGSRPHIIFRTNSTNLPVTANAYQSSLRGGTDYFIASFSGSSSPSLQSATYLGGSDDEGDEDNTGIAVDDSNAVYVTGATSSNDFPLLGQYQDYSGSGDVFVTKLSNWELSSLDFSTYLGGDGPDSGEGIAADNDGNVYITGSTYSSDFPLENPFIDHYMGNGEAFVTKLTYEPDPVNPVVNYSVQVVPGDGGSVDKENQLVIEGKDVTINIFPDEGYEIDKIFDNGVEMDVSNPYIINDIQGDHTVEITFKRILYPPVLSLTGVRKTEKAWIIQKDYAELKISISEHEYPEVVSAYVLYKNVSGVWSETKSYSGAGVYEYTDKYFKKGESVDYKLSAIAPDGSIIVETTLTL